MKINVKRFLLLTIFICICCTGSAYAYSYPVPAPGPTLSFNPAPPFVPGEPVEVTAHVSGLFDDEGTTGPLSGAHVRLGGEAIPGWFAEGYTDNNGEFTAIYTHPIDAIDGGGMGAHVYTIGGSVDMNGREEYTMDYYCRIVPPTEPVVAISQSFSLQPPFWPGEQVAVTASVEPAQSGVHVQLQCEKVGFYAEGYTDENGKFTGTFTCPDNALELSQSSSNPGGLYFSAVCPTAQSLDTYCSIVPKPEDPAEPPAPVGISQSFSPQPPFWPGEQVAVTASVGPAQSGVHVQLQSELGGYFAEGYTDSDGKFTGTYTVPGNALEWVQSSPTGSIRFSAYCPEAGIQSLDTSCEIIPEPISSVVSISMPSFNPQPPFWPGKHVDVTATVYPAQSGIHVQLQSELGGYFAEGYTDNNGKFTGTYIVPDNALEWVKSSDSGGIRFSANCPDESIPYSGDISCKIIPEPAEDPQIPEFPSIVVPVVAILGMIAIVGRRKM